MGVFILGIKATPTLTVLSLLYSKFENSSTFVSSSAHLPFSQILTILKSSLKFEKKFETVISNPLFGRISLPIGVLLNETFSFLDSVQALNFTVEEETYVAVLNLYKWKTARSEGRRVYSCLLGLKIVLGVEIGNALMGMLVKFGDLGDAWKVFGKMFERDVYSWNMLVDGYAKAGWFDETLSLYHKMLWASGGDGMRPDEFTLPCVLKTCGGMSDLGRGREVHAHVLRFRVWRSQHCDECHDCYVCQMR